MVTGCRRPLKVFPLAIGLALLFSLSVRGQGLLSDQKGVTSCEAILPYDEAKGFGIRTVLWPGQVIPYVLEENMRSDIRAKVEEAIEIVNAETNVCLIPRLREGGYVEIFQSTENIFYAYVGKDAESQSQPVAIGPDLIVILHELGHAMGLLHEHQRPDRDAFIRINYENVSTGFYRNFDILQENTLAAGPYDYGSIMHYGPTAFTKNGKPTIEPLDTMALLGNERYSKGDIQAINALYPDPTVDCEKKARERSPIAGFSYSFEEGYVCAGSAVQFFDKSTGPETTSWRWEFNNGEPASSEEPNPSVTFPEPGIYAVALEAANAYGSSRFQTTIEVKDPAQLPMVIYPNPSAGLLTTKAHFKPNQTVEVQVFSLTGELLQHFQTAVYDCYWEEEIELSSNLPSGLYFLRFTAGSDSRVRKIQIQRH